MEGQERGEGKEEFEERGDLWMGDCWCLRGDCLRGEWSIGERMGLPGEEQMELESVVSRSSLASCQHSGTPNLQQSINQSILKQANVLPFHSLFCGINWYGNLPPQNSQDLLFLLIRNLKGIFVQSPF